MLFLLLLGWLEERRRRHLWDKVRLLLWARKGFRSILMLLLLLLLLMREFRGWISAGKHRCGGRGRLRASHCCMSGPESRVLRGRNGIKWHIRSILWSSCCRGAVLLSLLVLM